MIDSFEKLEVWKKSHQLTLLIYKITKAFPPEERFILVNQLRRATLSIETNIAEGSGRRTTKNLIGFLYIAKGSLQEVRSLLRVSFDLNYLDRQKFECIYKLIVSILMMMNKLITNLSKKMAIK